MSSSVLQLLGNLATELSWQVLIEGYLTPLLFVHQLTFGVEDKAENNRAKLYIRTFKVSAFQAMGISTVGKA